MRTIFSGLRLAGRILLVTFVGAIDIVELALRRVARRHGFLWGRSLYAVVLLSVILLTAATASGRPEDLPSYGRYVFGCLCAIQLSVALFFPPVMMAHTLAQERRRGTIGMLLLCHRSPAHVVRGLLTSRLLVLLAIFLAGAPVASMAAMMGGVSAHEIVLLVLSSVALALFGGSLGALLGADTAPRAAPFLAFVATLLALWLLHYPLVLLGVLSMVLASSLPVWLIVVLLCAIVTPLLLLFHGFMTRQAGNALLRRLGEVGPLPPQPSAPKAPDAATATNGAAPAARRTPRGARSQDLLRLFSRELAGVSLVRPAGLLLGLAVVSVGVAVIPGTPILGIVRGMLASILGLGGFLLLGALVLAVSFYPVYRISQLRSDATLVLVAMAPLDPGDLLAQMERTVLAVVALGVTAFASTMLPLLAGEEALAPARLAVSTGLLFSLVGFVGALSAWIGSRARSTLRGIVSMMGVWVGALASLALGAFGGITFHPLVAPFSFALDKGPDFGGTTFTWVLLPCAFLLRTATARRLRSIWREPFEALAEEAFSFG